MNGQPQPYTFDRVVRLVLSVSALVALLLVLRYLSDVLLPFAAAIILAYLLNPLVTVVEQKTHRRGLAVAMTIGGIVIVGMGAIAVLLPLFVIQAGRFGESLSRLRDDLAMTLPTGLDGSDADSGDDSTLPQGKAEKSVTGFAELREGWQLYRAQAGQQSRSKRFAVLLDRISGTYVGDFIARAVTYTKSDEFNVLLLDAVKGLAIGGWTVVAFAINALLALTGLIIVLLYLVFLLLDFPEYARTWPTFLPPQYRDRIVGFLGEFNAVMGRYFRGQAVVAVCVGALFSIGFSLMGMPMAVPFGLFVGLLNMVPYLQTVALIPGVLLAGLRAIEGGSSFVVSIALTLLVFGVVQLIQDSLIVPRIIGKATGLRPVAILLGVFIWGKLLGFLGVLLAIPLTCVGIAYYRRYILLHAEEATRIAENPSIAESPKVAEDQ